MLKTKEIYAAVKPALAGILEPAGFKKEKRSGSQLGWKRPREDGRIEHVRAEVPRGMPWWHLQIGLSIPGEEPSLHPAFQFMTAEKWGRERRADLPPTPRMIDPSRGGWPGNERGRLEQGIARVCESLLGWVEDAAALDDALHGALEADTARPVKSTRKLIVEPATAFLGHYERVGMLAGVQGPPTFSADGRWVSLHEPGRVRIVDPETCAVTATVPMQGEPMYRHAVHPGGKLLAVRTADAIEVRGDQGLVHRVDRPPAPRFGAALMWDRAGRLWIADSGASDNHELAVYDEQLHRLAATEVPEFPEHLAPASGSPRTWGEPNFALHPPTNTVVCWHMGGDSFYSLTFHRLEDGKLVTAGPRVDPTGEGWDGCALVDVAVDPLGHEIVARDQYARLVVWSLPGCTPRVHGMPDAPTGEWDSVTHVGGAVLVPIVDDEQFVDQVAVYDPDDLHLVEQRTTLYPALWRSAVHGHWVAGLEGHKLVTRRLAGETVPVLRIRCPAVGEWMRGKGDVDWRVERILRPVDGGFEDVTSKALWSRRGRLVPSSDTV